MNQPKGPLTTNKCWKGTHCGDQIAENSLRHFVQLQIVCSVLLFSAVSFMLCCATLLSGFFAYCAIWHWHFSLLVRVWNVYKWNSGWKDLIEKRKWILFTVTRVMCIVRRTERSIWCFPGMNIMWYINLCTWLSDCPNMSKELKKRRGTWQKTRFSWSNLKAVDFFNDFFVSDWGGGQGLSGGTVAESAESLAERELNPGLTGAFCEALEVWQECGEGKGGYVRS